MWKSIRASASISGVFPPLIDGDKLLVDGGMVNNLPADVMQAYEDIGTTIALDVSGPVTVNTSLNLDGYFSGWQVFTQRLNPLKKVDSIPKLASTLMHAALTKSAETELHTKNMADYHFNYPVTDYGLLEFDKPVQITETGYNYIKEKMSKLVNDSSFDLPRSDLSKPDSL